MAAFSRQRLEELAQEAGFSLCGVARPQEDADFERYQKWLEAGLHGSMGYLSDHRAQVRRDPRLLLESCRSVISLGSLYQSAYPHTRDFECDGKGWISRYAWGMDYHDDLKRKGRVLAERLNEESGGCATKVLVDTSPMLERTYARLAGLGWIGKNTCLINQGKGSWFFLAEVLTDLEIEPDVQAPERCGSCTRCIEVCPTAAIVPAGDWWTVDARRCISYLTIEHRGPINEELREGLGAHVFGCDLCQDVCPWNGRAPVSDDPAVQPRMGQAGVDLDRMAALSEEEFRAMFRPTPVSRAKYSGFMRNVALAMGNTKRAKYRSALEILGADSDAVVAESAQWALRQLAHQVAGRRVTGEDVDDA